MVINKVSSILPEQTTTTPSYVNMDKVASIVLCGGEGKRLFPLTQKRCKPALIFGGRYRLVDVPISSSINSGIRKIFLLTQYLSAPLHQHIMSTYRFDSFSLGSIHLLSAEQNSKSNEWFEGTADAVRKMVDYIKDIPVEYFLILSGDQLYNIQFQRMVQMAKSHNADAVVASTPVDMQNAKRMGIMKVCNTGKILDFIEKPNQNQLKPFYADANCINKLGINYHDNKNYIASMGIYLFKRELLLDLLSSTNHSDFGKHLIPLTVAQGKTYSFLYNGYWEDIGTVSSFYQANLALTEYHSKLNCYDEKRLIYSTPHEDLPPPKILNCKLSQTLICEGSVIDAKEITHSIIGTRSVLKKGSMIKDSYIMGNDFYSPPVYTQTELPQELCIDENCRIEKSIIDKNVYIGKGVKLINKNKLDYYDGEKIFIRDGIIIVMRGAHIPDGYEL